jgi:hypothetical protein
MLKCFDLIPVTYKLLNCYLCSVGSALHVRAQIFFKTQSLRVIILVTLWSKTEASGPIQCLFCAPRINPDAGSKAHPRSIIY